MYPVHSHIHMFSGELVVAKFLAELQFKIGSNLYTLL
jgi:hypothetical protein